MNNQPESVATSRNTSAILAEPGVARIKNINAAGAWALYCKEVRRFMKVQLQTVWGPALTTLLFLIVFTVAISGKHNSSLGVNFADFLAPGLIMMGMIQNSFANSSFSLLAGKMNGTLVDYLMPPLSIAEMLVAMIAAAVTRAIMVGIAIWIVMLLMPGLHVLPVHWWAVVSFGLLGPCFVGFIGVITSIWADKFDHAAAVTNFVIAPLALLSGTFYSVDRLSPTFQLVSHANPFFYAISGFRYGFVGAADTDAARGALILLVLNCVLAAVCYALLKSGWRLKA